MPRSMAPRCPLRSDTSSASSSWACPFAKSGSSASSSTKSCAAAARSRPDARVTWLRSSAADAAALAVLLLLSGLGSLWLGQDVSGDLRRYHYYLGFSLWEGRLGEDIAPGAQGTFFNPVLDALHYAGMA